MRVGIVIPAYNVAPYMGACIASVIAQSHQDWAIVVVDDGSTDGTADRVPKDARVLVLRQENAGVSEARNRGLQHFVPPLASGEDREEGRADAVLFLDADDLLAPGALARLVARLDASPDAGAAYGPYAFIPEQGGAPLRVKSGPFPSGDILGRLLVENLFANGGHLLIRARAAARVGRFVPGIAFGEDWQYWIRLAAMVRFAVVEGTAPLLLVRERARSAYRNMAADPASFALVMDAIFSNPTVSARLGPRLHAVRRLTRAENDWIVGRELVRHGRGGEGKRFLRRSVAAKPSLRRAALLMAAHAPRLVPARLARPFRSYPAG